MKRPPDPLRSAFQYEVRPDVYTARVWGTAIIAAVVLSGISCLHDGNLDLNFLFPAGNWSARDPAGALYMETWRAIISDALQVGFGLWGAELILRGLWRLAREFKFTVAAFSLGGAFVGFAYFVPMLSQPLAKMILEHYPFLAG